MESTTKDLYVIEEGGGTGFYKIGRSANPEERPRTLQTGNPRELRLVHTVPDAGGLEREVHDHLADRNVRGEWFNFKDGADPVAAVQEIVRTLQPQQSRIRTQRPSGKIDQRHQRKPGFFERLKDAYAAKLSAGVTLESRDAADDIVRGGVTSEGA